jgi:hypothetical protein
VAGLAGVSVPSQRGATSAYDVETAQTWGEGDAKSSVGDALRARWVMLGARWVMLSARWVMLGSRWVMLRARWVMLRARWVMLGSRWVMLRARREQSCAQVKVEWDDVAGLHDVKRDVELNLLGAMQRPELFTGLLQPARGILFYGPPGASRSPFAF